MTDAVANAVHAALQDKRVLVVEDEAIIALLFETELLDAGAEVVGPAATIGEALRLIEAAACDGGLSAAVLDIKLVDAEIRPVAERLAALGVPFLFATGYSDAAARKQHGGAPVLQKPLGVRELATAVEALAIRNRR
jgi:DNA-binding response OmpR family regulator